MGRGLTPRPPAALLQAKEAEAEENRPGPREKGKAQQAAFGPAAQASAGSAACGGGGGQRPVCPRQRTEEAKTDSSLGWSLCQATPTFKTCLETASTLDTLPRRQGKLGPKRMLIIKTPS